MSEHAGRRAEPATEPPLVEPGWPAEAGLIAMSVAAAIGMGRLFADTSFLPVVLAAVLASHGLSMACRRKGIGPLATTAASAAGLVLFVTWVIEPHVSLVPSPAVWDAARFDLGEAWGKFSEVVAPAEVTRGFVLGAALGSWISSFAADMFAFRARTRMEAVVPSFTVFLFGALLGSDRHRLAAALLYLGAVLLFVVLAEVAAAPRPRPWLAGRKARGEASILRSGLVMAGITLLAALLVGPNLPGAYATGVLGVGDGNRRKSGTRVTLSPLVDIRGRLVGQSSVELFTVTSDTPTYWRITSLDRFDGQIWSSLSNYRPAGARLPSVGPDARRAETETSRQEFEIAGLSSIWLPAAFRPTSLTPSGNVRFDPDSASLATDKATSDGMRYTVESALPRLTAQNLASAASAGVPPDISERYLDLPVNVSQRMVRLAQQAVGNESSPYRQAKALQDWFRDNFKYNLQVPAGHDGNAMEQFLQSRQGYCEQFAGTYAAMARSIGLPARVAVGFTTGVQDADGRYHVTGKEAHAWPEVYLSGFGWVAFEPTPGRGLPGAEDYTHVTPPQPAETTATTLPQTVAPSEQPEPEPEVSTATTTPTVEASRAGSRLAVVALLVGLAMLYGAGVPLLKHRRRQRRRDGAVTPADRVLVAWAEAAEDLTAAGLPPRPSETAVEFASRVGRTAGPGVGPALARLADDTTTASWSATGVGPEVATRAEAEAANVAAELRAQATRRERLRRALDPRPLFVRPKPPAGERQKVAAAA